jgi:hypothetical protein
VDTVPEVASSSLTDGAPFGNTLETGLLSSNQAGGGSNPRKVESEVGQCTTQEGVSLADIFRDNGHQPPETSADQPEGLRTGPDEGRVSLAELPPTSEQGLAVRMAQSLMSKSEQRTFERRACVRGGARVVSPSTTSDQDEGPSVATKGQGISPSN